MRLVTWNVAGRVGAQPRQAAALAAIEADVVALQEVTRRTLPMWVDALAAAQLRSVVSTVPDGNAPGRRRLCVLTAARAPLARLPGPPRVPWPERVLATRVALEAPVEVVNLHSPISPAPDLAKVRTHEAVAGYLHGAPAAGPIVLCGDLNTPRREMGEGDVLTFAHESDGRLRPERGERWAAAERSLVVGLAGHGFVDAYRSLHGYGERQPSWTYPRGGGGYRLDHVLVRGPVPREAIYAHAWRDAGLSDHSALVVELDLPAT
jgi:endonuclease/exonuclease/phosphatase family metal-dependent hydrolase